MEPEISILLRRDKILYYLSSQLAIFSGLTLGLYIYFTGFIIAFLSILVGLVAYIVLTYSKIPEQYTAKHMGYFILIGIVGSIFAPLFEIAIFTVLALTATYLNIRSINLFENKELQLSKHIDIAIILFISYWAFQFFSVFLLLTVIIQ